jgi:hypothetical protein
MDRYLINIHRPCHENWEEMTPVERGRFCAQCSRTVIDFSSSSDRDIIRFIESAKGNSFCGQFDTTQLNRWMEDTNIRTTNPALHKWLLGMLLLAASQQLSAQDSTVKSTTTTVAVAPNAKGCGSGIIKGVVYNRLGLPMPNAIIQLAHTGTGTTSAANGMFELYANIGDTLQVYSDRNLLRSVPVTDINGFYVLETSIIRQATADQHADTTGTPSMNKRILLRGMPSISTNTYPIYIVDGIAISHEAFMALDAKRLKTVTALKAEDAVRLYGREGTNGAIVVETKLPKKKRTGATKKPIR